MRFVEQIITAREQNDYDREVELKLQFWVDGRLQTPAQIDPHVRERARKMLSDRPEMKSEGQPLEPAAIGRLDEIAVPTLIIVGDQDAANIATIADLLAAIIRGAQKIVIPDSAHLPNREKPEHFNRVVLEFLQSNVP